MSVYYENIFLTKNSSSRLNLDAPVTCPVCNENLPNKRHLNPHFKIAHPVVVWNVYRQAQKFT